MTARSDQTSYSDAWNFREILSNTIFQLIYKYLMFTRTDIFPYGLNRTKFKSAFHLEYFSIDFTQIFSLLMILKNIGIAQNGLEIFAINFLQNLPICYLIKLWENKLRMR